MEPDGYMYHLTIEYGDIIPEKMWKLVMVRDKVDQVTRCTPLRSGCCDVTETQQLMSRQESIAFTFLNSRPVSASLFNGRLDCSQPDFTLRSRNFIRVVFLGRHVVLVVTTLVLIGGTEVIKSPTNPSKLCPLYIGFSRQRLCEHFACPTHGYKLFTGAITP
jgi:hypothetical protein